jgi:predicted Ser/Thr protein kinase
VTHAPTTEPSDLQIVRSALAADYDILGELGRGGMAIVYHARERALDRDVAVKVLPAAMAFDAELVERFQREARTSAQLEHPHIVPIYRVGQAGRVIYFVMKYLRGRPLSAVLAGRGTLTPDEIRRILLETGSALGYAAARGVIHRDVKPDNLVLDEGGRCVLTDFGIARSAADQRLTATGMSIGTPRYMSPEQARAKPADCRSDIYSLGVVAYECLTGRPPFDGDDALAILMDHVQKPLPRPALRTADERALFAVIERMLAKDPARRIQDADELAVALGALEVTPGEEPGRRSHPSSAPTAPSRRVTGGDGRALPTPPEGGIEPLLRLAAAQRPRLEALVAAVAAAGAATVAAGRPRLEAATAVAGRWLAARTPRFWTAVVGVALGGVIAHYGVHFATTHRSRCPQPAARVADGATPFTLLVDPLPAQGSGSEVELHYDVCGLADDAPFTTDVVVARGDFSLKRLLKRGAGGYAPVAVSFADEADGPATRRHRTIDAGSLDGGSYSVTVVVTDGDGRRRQRRAELVVRPD